MCAIYFDGAEIKDTNTKKERENVKIYDELTVSVFRQVGLTFVIN